MAKTIPVFLNCTRNAVLAMPPAIRKAEAMREVKMLVVPKALRRGIFDKDIPDKLVSEEMAQRYLEISPPVFSLIPDYRSIINEIEQSYVIGNDFSALSASCVVIERLLNQARIALHKHHKVIKRLWNKGPTNEWYPNIDTLRAVSAAYRPMTIFIGFPEDLFSLMGGKPTCENEADPRFLEFYKPYMQDEE